MMPLPQKTTPSIAEKEAAKSPAEKIAESQKRLQAAYQQEELDATKDCPLKPSKEREQEVPHGGRCPVCGKTHSVPRTDEANNEAKLLYEKVKRDGVGGQPSSLLDREKGNMFGVLVCIAPDGTTKTLQAFSGLYDSTGMAEADGWCPPVPSTDPKSAGILKEALDADKAEKEAKAAYNNAIVPIQNQIKNHREIIKDLKRKSDAEQKVCRDVIKQLPKENWNAEQAMTALEQQAKIAEIDSDYKQRIANEETFLSDLDRKMEELNPKKLQQDLAAAQKRKKDAEAALQNDNINGRKITNYRKPGEQPDPNSQRSFKDACLAGKDKAMYSDPRTGFCAAAKLLAEAKKQGLVPVALSEFWMGKPQGEMTDGTMIPSCECCRSFIGFALCGLQEAQTEKNKQLGEKKQ